MLGRGGVLDAKAFNTMRKDSSGIDQQIQEIIRDWCLSPGDTILIEEGNDTEKSRK